MGILSMGSLSTFAIVGFLGVATAQTLNPVQDIILPASQSATSPLEWLGANGPWFAGMLALGTLLCPFANRVSKAPMSTESLVMCQMDVQLSRRLMS